MGYVLIKQHFAYSAEKLWSLISEFDSIANYHPRVESVKSSQDKMIRTLFLNDGTQIVEDIIDVNHDTFEFSYSILDAPFNFYGYTSTMKLIERTENTCDLEWTASYDIDTEKSSEEKAVTTLEQFYRDGLDGMKQYLISSL